MASAIPSSGAPSVLVVEDDDRLRVLVAEYLSANGVQVTQERDGAVARDRILAEQPDVVLLDLMLPGLDGLSVCRAVREGYTGRILMLTARAEEIDQILGLELGADDYVAKPVSPRLLLARVRALLRRGVATPELEVDPARRAVRVRGQEVPLTTAEFDLLQVLVQHAGHPVDRPLLFRALRGIEYDGFDRGMDVRVSQLRKRLVDAGASPDLIKTVRGVGYQYTGTA